MNAKLLWLSLFVRKAFRPTCKNALRGSILTFSLSLLPLSLIYILLNGTANVLYERSVETFYYHAQVESPSFNPKSDLKKIQDLPPLKGVWEEKQSFGILIGKDDSREAVLLRGLEPDLLASSHFWGYLSNDKRQALNSPLILEEGEIALGKSLADNLSLKKGDKVNLITNRKIAGRLIAKISPFRIKEIISTGYAELDRTWALVSLFDEKDIFNPTTPSIWGVKFLEINLEKIPSLTNHLNKKKDSLIQWKAWTELNQNQRDNFESLEILFYTLFSLIVLVAGFNVSSALIIYTIEQSHSLAIFKAMGSSPSCLKIAFTLLGAIIGFLGSLLGLLLSLVLAAGLNSFLKTLFEGIDLIYGICLSLLGIYSPKIMESLQECYYLGEIPTSLPFSFLILILGISILITTLASLWASRRLVQIKPKLLLN